MKTHLILSLLIVVWQVTSQTAQEICQAIPYNFITPCDIKCVGCLSTGERQKCDSCQSYFDLNSQSASCEVPQDKTYHISRYLQTQKIVNSSDLGKFTTQNGLLTDDTVLTFCIANAYRFDVAGLFSDSTVLTHRESYDLDIDKLSVSFRLFIDSPTYRVQVQINNIVMYDRQYTSDLSLNYTKEGTRAIVQNDPTPFLDSVFVPIQTGLLSMEGNQGKDFQIVINVNSGSQVFRQFWGISEVMFVARQCDVCVTEATKLLQRVLGIVIGITAGIVIVLMIVLMIVNTIKQKNQKRKMKSRIEAMLKDKMNAEVKKQAKDDMKKGKNENN